MSPTKRQYWKTKKFKALSEEWDEKLAKSGFHDAEKTVNGQRELVSSGNPYRNSLTEDVKEAKANYFRYIGQCVYDEYFPNYTDELIMKRYSEGVLIKDICKELKRKGFRPLSTSRLRHIVGATIKQYEAKWATKHPTK